MPLLFKDPSTSLCAFSDSPIPGTYQRLEGRRTRALRDRKGTEQEQGTRGRRQAGGAESEAHHALPATAHSAGLPQSTRLQRSRPRNGVSKPPYHRSLDKTILSLPFLRSCFQAPPSQAAQETCSIPETFSHPPLHAGRLEGRPGDPAGRVAQGARPACGLRRGLGSLRAELGGVWAGSLQRRRHCHTRAGRGVPPRGPRGSRSGSRQKPARARTSPGRACFPRASPRKENRAPLRAQGSGRPLGREGQRGSARDRVTFARPPPLRSQHRLRRRQAGRTWSGRPSARPQLFSRAPPARHHAWAGRF